MTLESGCLTHMSHGVLRHVDWNVIPEMETKIGGGSRVEGVGRCGGGGGGCGGGHIHGGEARYVGITVTALLTGTDWSLLGKH